MANFVVSSCSSEELLSLIVPRRYVGNDVSHQASDRFWKLQIEDKVSTLLKGLSHTEKQVRLVSAEFAKGIGDKRLADALIKLIAFDQDKEVRSAAAHYFWIGLPTIAWFTGKIPVYPSDYISHLRIAYNRETDAALKDTLREAIQAMEMLAARMQT